LLRRIPKRPPGAVDAPRGEAQAGLIGENGRAAVDRIGIGIGRARIEQLALASLKATG
jgi:hypothetical protein